MTLNTYNFFSKNFHVKMWCQLIVVGLEFVVVEVCLLVLRVE